MIRRLLAVPENAQKVAVIEDGEEIRAGKLLQKALALRPFLPRKAGENVAILLPDGGDYIAAFWGIVMAGATAFPLNVSLTRHEIFPLLKQASVHTVVTGSAYAGLFALFPEVNVVVIDELKEADFCPESMVANVDRDAPMVLLCTSGTTGKAKIVKLSERSVTASVSGYLDKLDFSESAKAEEGRGGVRFTFAAPFSTVYGLMILSACLSRSFPIVILPRPFTLDALFRAAEKYRITHHEGSGTVVSLMKKMIGRDIPYDVRSLTYYGFGGGKIFADAIEKVRRAYPGVELYQGYGMTEASPLIAKHPQGKLTKTESVGTAIQGTSIFVDCGDGITQKPFAEGEIVVRGANVMLGYLDDQAETERVLKNGYLYTGDIGYLDEEKYLYICGRKKNVVLVRGFTVYPEEVEERLLKSGLLEDCVVYGRATGDGNETVCADVVPFNPGLSAAEIQAYCVTHLAEYKRPLKITFCDAIRRDELGKAGGRWDEGTTRASGGELFLKKEFDKKTLLGDLSDERTSS